MESHKRILGILFIISGILHLFGMLFLSFLFSLIFPLIFEHAHLDDQWVLVWVFPFLKALAGIVILLVAIPSIIGGWGMLAEKKWAMVLILVLGCLKLFSFPFGTALGIYTIWVYTEDHKQKTTQKI